MFWVLVLGLSVHMQRTLATLKREFEKAKGTTMSDGSWYPRFTPELVSFLRLCVIRGIEQLAQEAKGRLSERLVNFKDVMIQDSTIVRLHRSLAKKWPAARSIGVAAGVKVSLLISAVATGPKNVALYGERTSDVKTLRIGRWVRDRILLLDLGFYKHQVFARIKENGGYFVTRLKDNADPLIVSANRVWRGRCRDVVGRHVREVLPLLKRKILDVDVEVRFRRRSYHGKRSGDAERFRLVAVFNDETREYHLYLTNIPPDVLTPEEVASLYGARWDIELVFKELKSRYALDKIKTRNPDIVQAYIWLAMLTLLVSRRIYNLVRSRNPPGRIVRFTQARWSRVFAENAGNHLTAILHYCGIERTFFTDFDVYNSQALDPHVNRHRFKEGLWS